MKLNGNNVYLHYILLIINVLKNKITKTKQFNFLENNRRKNVILCINRHK